jgi:hypothetical protein
MNSTAPRRLDDDGELGDAMMSVRRSPRLTAPISARASIRCRRPIRSHREQHRHRADRDDAEPADLDRARAARARRTARAREMSIVLSPVTVAADVAEEQRVDGAQEHGADQDQRGERTHHDLGRIVDTSHDAFEDASRGRHGRRHYRRGRHPRASVCDRWDSW